MSQTDISRELSGTIDHTVVRTGEPDRHIISPLPGTYTTADTPAKGAIVIGGVVYPGTFVARGYSTINSRSGELTVQPYSKTGADLTKTDGTTFEDVMSLVTDAGGEIMVAGVATGEHCANPCERYYGTHPCPPFVPNGLQHRNRHARPYDEGRNPAQAVSYIVNDWIRVYCNTDIDTMEEFFITHTVAAESEFVYGGIQNAANVDGNLGVSITATRFKSASVEIGDEAGGAAQVHLG